MFTQEVLRDGINKWAVHRELCYEITTELQSFPCSYIFDEPIECKVPDQQNQNNVVPRNLSFPIILGRIADGTYLELKEWLFDMKLLMSSQVRKHFGKAEILICIDFMKRFQTRMKRFNLLTVAGWYKRSLYLKLKVDSLIQNSPEGTQKFFPYPSSGVEFTTKRIGSSQIEYILQNYNQIKKPVDIRKLQNIISNDVDAPAPTDGLLDVDLCELKQPTLCKVYDFIRSRLPDVPAPDVQLYVAPCV